MRAVSSFVSSPSTAQPIATSAEIGRASRSPYRYVAVACEDPLRSHPLRSPSSSPSASTSTSASASATTDCATNVYASTFGRWGMRRRDRGFFGSLLDTWFTRVPFAALDLVYNSLLAGMGGDDASAHFVHLPASVLLASAVDVFLHLLGLCGLLSLCLLVFLNSSSSCSTS